MAVNGENVVLTAVEDLKEGDVIDLAGDSYADEEDFGEYDYEYAVVQHVDTYESYSRKTTAVEFLHDGMEAVVAFPFGHRVQVVTGVEEKAS